MGLPHSRNVYPDTQQTSLVDVSLAFGIGTVDSGITLAALAEESLTQAASKRQRKASSSCLNNLYSKYTPCTMCIPSTVYIAIQAFMHRV